MNWFYIILCENELYSKGTLKIYWFEGGIADKAIKYHKKNWIMEIIVWKHFIDLSEFRDVNEQKF